MELVKDPPCATSSNGCEIVLVVPGIDNCIDKVGHLTTWHSRDIHKDVLVSRNSVFEKQQFHLASVAMARCWSPTHISRGHVDADGQFGIDLKKDGPMVSPVLKNGMANKVNNSDDKVGIANGVFVRFVNEAVKVLELMRLSSTASPSLPLR
ncbi:hypothetical protein VTK73DRAFT_9537 [Phialemonium thermophilum]|uniref:Uncharacterized protein n=1 Tax=Phialemonium thermophilum TaxID=223376 RepID=A0ABR3XL26_9PEZI